MLSTNYIGIGDSLKNCACFHSLVWRELLSESKHKPSLDLAIFSASHLEASGHTAGEAEHESPATSPDDLPWLVASLTSRIAALPADLGSCQKTRQPALSEVAVVGRRLSTKPVPFKNLCMSKLKGLDLWKFQPSCQSSPSGVNLSLQLEIPTGCAEALALLFQ